MAKSTDILNTTFKNANGINAFFKELGFKGFVDYWNTKHSKKGFFGNQTDTSGRIRHARGPISSEKRWEDVWNNIHVSFNKNEVNLVEFLCINSIVLNESPSFKPSTEYFGRKGFKGISYTYSKISGTKRSYNTLADAGNKTAYDLFNDPVYIKEHGHLPFSSRYKNTNDSNWKTGTVFPPGNNSKETGGKVSFLTEADFHKYRGRGFIQLTGRANYAKLIKIVLDYKGNNSVIKKMRTKWTKKVGTSVDKIATISSNKDWDKLFQKTNNIIANASLWAHAERTKYSWITPTDDEHKLRNDIRNVAKKIAGGGATGYHDLFEGRIYQQINDILGDENAIPFTPNTTGANDNSNGATNDTGQPERRESSDNSNNSSGSAQLPKVEGLTNFSKPTSVVPKAIKFDAGRSKAQANEIKDTIGYLPFVSYNGTQIEPRYITSFGLSVNELLPVVKIVFEDQYGLMNDTGTPLDDSKITIFISSRSPALKSIFMEFKITSFSNTGNTYVMSGVSNINGMFLRKFESYSNMSSFQCLQEFAKRNGLGFNSNVNDSGDKMTWINPGMRGSEFIKDVIAKSYRNDSSFIWCYVDPYYNLNYIDVEEAFKIDISASIGIHTIGLNNIKDFKDNNKIIELLLTNDTSMSDSNHYFSSWKLINNSTSISLDKGYLNKVKFYDIGDLDFLIFDIDSITSEGDNTIIMKSSPQDEAYFNEHVTTTYVGKLDKDNMHKNYNYSIVQNKQNIDDVQKLGIRIEMPSPNFNLYRFQKVSVILTNKGSTPTHGLVNNRLTGEWLIIDIKYNQMDGKFSQTVTLVKREMELSPEELSNENPPNNKGVNTTTEQTTNPDDSVAVVDSNGNGRPDSVSKDDFIKWKWELEWSNSKEIDDFFIQYNTEGFIGWFSKEFGSISIFKNNTNIEVGDASESEIGGSITNDGSSNEIINKERWTKVWNSIPTMYNDVRNGDTSDLAKGKAKVNAIEFLAMNTLIQMLVGTDYKPIKDGRNLIETFKSNNSKSVNETAFKSFNDKEYNTKFSNQPFAALLKDTTDNRWKSDAFPVGFSGSGVYTGGFRDLSNDILDTDEFTITFNGITETYVGKNTPVGVFDFLITGVRETDYNALISLINTKTQFNITAYISNNGYKKTIAWSDEADELKSLGISSGTDKGLLISSEYGTQEASLQSSGLTEKETSTSNNGYITNADFHKFRKRGFIPMIGRKEYLNIIDFVASYTGEDTILKEFNEKWTKSVESVGGSIEVTQDVTNTNKNRKIRAYISQDEDWDKIMLDNNINQAVIASISNYFHEKSKEHIFDSNRSEDKVLKSIQNIAKGVKKDLPDFDTENYIQRVKSQIELLDKTVLNVISASKNPVALRPKQSDISNLKSGGKFDSWSRGKKIGKEDTVIFRGVLVIKKIAPSLVTMFDAAKLDSVTLKLNSSFRTNEDQVVNGVTNSGQFKLFDIYKHNEGVHATFPGHKGGFSQKGNLAAIPGTSKHQIGIAVDISARKNSEQYAWLVENAWKYGFVRKVNKERWHWEYRPDSRMFSFVKDNHATWDGLPNKFGLI